MTKRLRIKSIERKSSKLVTQLAFVTYKSFDQEFHVFFRNYTI
jgi:hypothetical protein